jgi:hypothetical protein
MPVAALGPRLSPARGPLAVKRALVAATLAGLAWASPLPAEEPSGLPLAGEAAETFLRTAEVVGKRALSIGITRSDQYTLSDGSRTHKAVFKTIDEFKRGVTSFEGGGVIVDFADSYKHEIAAYELDKLLGCELVPPTVERTFGRTTGSLQLWVEGAMTEADRKQRKIHPPDGRGWNEQMYKVRLLHQLTYNTDSRNIRNVLIDRAFRIYAIDFSRAFVRYSDLPSEKDLVRFSRSALEALKALDRATLDARLGRWLGRPQIEGLLERRDKILALAERRVREQGEAAVLY